MSLNPNTLANELKALGLYDNEIDAINVWTAAFKTYFLGATSNSAPIASAALTPAEAAMKGAMVGLSTRGAEILQAGIIAFWGAIVPAVAWPGVTAITPPPPLPSLSGALTAVFLTNTVGGLSKDDCMTAIASIVHAANMGGIAAWPVPVGPMPIL